DDARRMSVALMQPFVTGVPMSASFLVGKGPQAWLVGMGIQRMTIDAGRFEYRGGTMPIMRRRALAPVGRAVVAIEGLRGFVGVDFIWDAAHGRAPVLEINPRPTTSCVGLCRLLPPGWLARAWLCACAESSGDFALLEGLSKVVHAQKRVSFNSKG